MCLEENLIPDFNLTSNPVNFVFCICKNLWLQELYKRKKYREPGFFQEVSNLVLAEDSEQSELKEKLLNIIEINRKRLPPRARELYLLKFKNLKLTRIAEIMGLKNGNMAKAKTYQAKNRLIELIKEDKEYLELKKNEPERVLIE